jgi:hypothetical protein
MSILEKINRERIRAAMIQGGFDPTGLTDLQLDMVLTLAACNNEMTRDQMINIIEDLKRSNVDTLNKRFSIVDESPDLCVDKLYSSVFPVLADGKVD